jgi:hypothetical protein
MVQALTGIEAQLRVRQSGVCCVRSQMAHCLRAISDNLTAALALELRGRSASTKTSVSAIAITVRGLRWWR